MKVRITRLKGFGRTPAEEFRKSSITLGTAAGNDVRFDPAWDRGVAANHARIECTDDGCCVMDAGSQTGTLMNGRRLAGAQPIDGPLEIELGDGGPRVRIEVLAEPVPSRAATPVPARAPAMQAPSFAPSQPHRRGIPVNAILVAVLMLGLAAGGGLWLLRTWQARSATAAARPTTSDASAFPMPDTSDSSKRGSRRPKPPVLESPPAGPSRTAAEELAKIKSSPAYLALRRFWEQAPPKSPFIKGFLQGEDAWYSAFFSYLARATANDSVPGIFIGECFDPGLALPGAPVSPPQMIDALKPALLKGNHHSSLETSAPPPRSQADNDAARESVRARFQAFAEGLQGAKTVAPKAWAVLVGINEFEHNPPCPPLRSCRNDVVALAKVLTSQGIFEPEGIRLMTDARKETSDYPTKENVLSALREAIAKAAPEDLLLIAISSHGGYDDARKDAFFCTVDTTNDMKGIYGSELQALLAQAKARNILLMIDACHSGGNPALGASQAMIRGIPATPAPRQFAAVPERFYEELASARGHVVIRACRADQTTPDLFGIGIGQSLLTLAVLSGLTGDADANGDGIVTLSELRIHVTKAIPRISKLAAEAGEDQTGNHGPLEPTFTSGGLGEAGDLPLTVVAPSH